MTASILCLRTQCKLHNIHVNKCNALRHVTYCICMVTKWSTMIITLSWQQLQLVSACLSFSRTIATCQPGTCSPGILSCFKNCSGAQERNILPMHAIRGYNLSNVATTYTQHHKRKNIHRTASLPMLCKHIPLHKQVILLWLST